MFNTNTPDDDKNHANSDRGLISTLTVLIKVCIPRGLCGWLNILMYIFSSFPFLPIFFKDTKKFLNLNTYVFLFCSLLPLYHSTTTLLFSSPLRYDSIPGKTTTITITKNARIIILSRTKAQKSQKD